MSIDCHLITHITQQERHIIETVVRTERIIGMGLEGVAKCFYMV